MGPPMATGHSSYITQASWIDASGRLSGLGRDDQSPLDLVAQMSANDGEVEDLRHENKMLKEELNAEMEAANELRLAVAHQTSVLYVTAAVAAAAVAAAAYLAAKLRQNQH